MNSDVLATPADAGRLDAPWKENEQMKLISEAYKSVISLFLSTSDL